MNIQINDFAKKINGLYLQLQQSQKDSKEKIREYNKLIHKKYKIRNNEDLLQFKYCEYLKNKNIQYREQVNVKNGRIDLLTDEYLIEFKKDSFDNLIYQAIGQLEYYSYFFPNKKLKIIVPKNISMKMLSVLEMLNIESEVFDVDEII